MKRALRTIGTTGLYHFVDGVRIAGAPSDLWGDVSGLRGNVSDLWGNVSGLWGNVSGLRGNVSGLRGDVGECEITDEERENGVDVSTLVSE